MLSARSSEALNEVKGRILSLNLDCEVQTHECDVSCSDSVGRLANEVETTLGRVDALIVNSGYAGDVILDVKHTPPESARKAIETNYLGTFHAAHHFVDLLIKTDQGAKAFLVIGSLGAAIVNGPIANAQYNVSKMAQTKLVEHIHEQFSKDGLLSVCIHPGQVLTRMACESKGAEDFLQCKSILAICANNSCNTATDMIKIVLIHRIFAARFAFGW